MASYLDALKTFKQLPGQGKAYPLTPAALKNKTGAASAAPAKATPVKFMTPDQVRSVLGIKEAPAKQTATPALPLPTVPEAETKSSTSGSVKPSDVYRSVTHYLGQNDKVNAYGYARRYWDELPNEWRVKINDAFGAPEGWYKGENWDKRYNDLLKEGQKWNRIPANAEEVKAASAEQTRIGLALEEAQKEKSRGKASRYYGKDVEMWYTPDNLQQQVDADRREKARFRAGATNDDTLITPVERQMTRDEMAQSNAAAAQISTLRQADALMDLNKAETWDEARKAAADFMKHGSKAEKSFGMAGQLGSVERDYEAEAQEMEKVRILAGTELGYYMYGGAPAGYKYTYKNAEEAASVAREAERAEGILLNQASEEEENEKYRAEYQKWIDLAADGGNGDAYKQYVSTGEADRATLNAATGTYLGADTDALLYDYINGDTATKEAVAGILMTNDRQRWRFDQQIYDHLTAQEKTVYNAIYRNPKHGPDKAMEYLEFLKTTVTARDRAENEKWAKQYAQEHPFLSSVWSTAEKVLFGGEALLYQGADLLTKGEIDPNAPYNRSIYESNAIRQQVSSTVEKKWGKVGSFAYNTGMSMADFLVALGLSGGNGTLSMAIMASSTAPAETLDALERGVSSGKAYTLGILSGIAEALTEKYSIEALLDTTKLGKSAAGYVLKNMITEGTEEGASNLLNLVADVMISQDKSRWRQSIDAYVASGMSEKEAFRKALLDQAESLGLDMLGGAASGGFMASGPAMVKAAGNRLENSKKAASRTETTGVPQYDIVALDNGNIFVKASRNIITGKTVAEQRKNITDFFHALLEGRSFIDIETIEGDVLTITKAETADKARDNYKQVNGMPVKMSDDEFAVKLRVETHIDEVAEISKQGRKGKTNDTKDHAFAKDGFTYRTAYFEDFDGRYYKVTLSVGNNGTTATVYNVGKIEGSVPPSAKVLAVVGSKALGETLPIEELSTRQTLHADVNQSENNGEANAQLSGDIIPDSAGNSNTNFAAAPSQDDGGVEGAERRTKGLFGYKAVEPGRWHEFARAEKIARRFGMNFRVDTISNGAEGRYLNGTITISPTAQHPVRQVLIHELTHHMERSGLYESFSNMILNYAANKMQVDVESAKQAVMKEYAGYGTTLDDTGAAKELVAKYAEEYLFRDEASVRRLMRQDRNLFDKVYNWICDTLEKLGGKDSDLTEAEQFLREAEAMYKRVLEDAGSSADVAANGVGQYSLIIRHADGTAEELSSAKDLTNEQAVNYLNRAKSGELRRETYVPVRKDTPQVIIDTMAEVGENVGNHSLVMQVRKAQQSMSDSNSGRRAGKYGNNIRSHALTPDQIVEIMGKLDDPSMAIYQTNRTDSDGNPLPNNVAFFVEYDNNGTESVAVIEFDSSIDPQFIGTEHGDTNYHSVVTVFKPDVERNGMPFDYAEELLSNPNNIELEIKRRPPEGSATGANQPNTSNELSSKDSIRTSDSKNNPQNAEGQNSMGSSFSELAERAGNDPSQPPAAENDLYDLDEQGTLDEYLEALTNQEMMGMFPTTEEEARARAQDLDEYFELAEDLAKTIAPTEQKATEPETDGSEYVTARIGKEKETPGQKIRNAWNYFKRKMVDSGTTVTEIGKRIGDRHLYHYYNMARASSNAAISMITGNRTDIYGRNTGKSLNEVFGEARKKGTEYYERFQLYLLHTHNVDRMSQDKPAFGKKYDAVKSRDVADRLLRENPEFADMAKEVYAYNHNLMQYRVDSGLITQADADRFESLYPHYVPVWYMDKDGKPTLIRPTDSVRIGSTVKRAKGGEGQIMPLHLAMAQQTMSVVREGSKNRFGQRMLNDEAGKTGHIKSVEEAENVFHEHTFDDPNAESEELKKSNVFTVLRGGKRYDIEVSPALFEAVKALSPDTQETNAATKIVRKGNDLFKKMVTGYNPVFLVRNFFRDLQDAMFYSKDLSEFAKNYPQAWREITRNGEYWQRYQALGGTYSSIFDYDTGEMESGGWVKRNIINRIELLNQAVEQAPRLAEFMATMKKNGGLDADMDTAMEAMYNAADITVNFGRSGTLGKVLNANYIPFLNPSIQGFDKMIRNVTETSGARNWFRLIGKAALFGFAPTLINGLLYEDDDEWEDIKKSDKDTNYLFKLRDGLWLKIPKGRTLSLLGMTADRAKDATEGKEIDWGGFIQTAAAQTAPANPLEENILKAWFDADLLDKDSPGKSWYGGDIENQRLQGYEPGQRYDAKTDVLSKWLGEKLNLSPKKINYLLDQYSGVAGDVLLPLLTPTAERDMFSAAFTVDTAASNRLSQDFYSTLDELTYKKNDPAASGEDAAMYQFWNKQGSAISEVNKAIRAIEEDETLSDKDKKDLIHAQYAIRNGIIKAAEGNYDAYEAAVKEYYAKAYGTREEKEDYAYLMANRDVLGAEYALVNYNKSAYEKAQELNKEGISYDDTLEIYLDFKAADDLPTADAYRREREIVAGSGLTEDDKVKVYRAFVSDKKDEDIAAFLDAGMTFDDYLHYESAVYGLGSDDTSTKKEKVMDAINAMDITDEQKDAAYLASGYSEKLIGTAPWNSSKPLGLPAPGKSTQAKRQTKTESGGTRALPLPAPGKKAVEPELPKLELEKTKLPALALPR